jgi:hypothetical protein
LDWNVHGACDPLDFPLVHWPSEEGTIQIDNVQSYRPFLFPSPGYIPRSIRENRSLIPSSLEKPNAFPFLEVNRRNNVH